MIIQVREIPEEGIHLEGDIQEDIFQLKPTESKPAGPVHYDLFVSIVSDSILVQGSLSVPFEMECVRCLETFVEELKRPDFAHSEPLEGRSSIDLTDPIREDILLVLPIHPHCDAGNQRECPATDQFEPSEQLAEEAGNGDAWGKLEGFNPSSEDQK